MEAKLNKIKKAKNDDEVLKIIDKHFKTYSDWILRMTNDEILTFRVSKEEIQPNININRCVDISIVDDENLEFMIETGIIEYIDAYEPDNGDGPYEAGDIEYDNPNEYILTLKELIEHFIDENADSQYECVIKEQN